MDQRPEDVNAPLQQEAVAPPGDDVIPADGTPAVGAESAEAPTPEPGQVAAPSSRSRLRWIIAAGVAVAAVGGAIVAAMILGAKPAPEALRYVPAGSVIVIELRPELPGDQLTNVGAFLAHFPGFADSSNLREKLDESLGRIVGEGSAGEVDYESRIKPLLAGPMALGMTAEATTAMSRGIPAGLVVATTDGSVECDDVFGPTGAGEVHRDVAIRSVQNEVACALDGKFMLLGDTTSVKAAIDAQRDGKGMDGSSKYRTARQQLDGDQVAVAFFDGKGFAAILAAVSPGIDLGTSLATGIPEWIVIGLRFVDDAAVVQAESAPVEAPPMVGTFPTAPPAAASRFVSMLPADAFGFMEVHGVGASVKRAIAQLKADPKQATTVEQVEQALGAAGGLDNVIGWMEEVGIAVVPMDESVGGVVLIRGTDAAATSGRLAQIRNLLILGSTGTDMTVRDTDHDGVTVTTVDLGDLDTVLAALGVPPGTLGSGTRASFSLAAMDDVLLLGIGEDVVERILDVESGASLAAGPTYRRFIELGDSPNDIELYVAIDGIVTWVEANVLEGAVLDSYQRDIKPYLEHLAGFGESSVTTSSGAHAWIVLTVK